MKKIAFVLANILFFAALGEVYLRTRVTHVSGKLSEIYKDTSKGSRLLPNLDVTIRNHQLSGMDIHIRTNSLGMRDDEIPAEKKDFRILVLGDSITVADYVQRNETWVEIAEKKLNATGKRYSLVNAGVSGIGLSEEVDILYESGPRVKPDMILLAYYLNDPRPSWGFRGEMLHKGTLRRNSVLADQLYRTLKLRKLLYSKDLNLFGWVKHAQAGHWRNDPEAFRALMYAGRIDFGASWFEQGISALQPDIERLRAYAERHNIPVVVGLFPVVFQVEAAFIDDAPQKRLAEEFGKRGFKSFDLLPALRAEKKRLFFDHCHPTVEGNAIIGEEVGKRLIQIMSPKKPKVV